MKVVDLEQTRDPLDIHHAITEMLGSQRAALASGRRDAYMLELLQRQCISMQAYLKRLRVILVMREDSTDEEWAGVEHNVARIALRERTMPGGVR